MRMELSRPVAAPPEVVWEVMVDLSNAPETMSAIEKIEIVSGTSPVTVGTTWRETRKIFGRSSTEEMSVTALDPGRSYTVTSTSSGAQFVSVLSVEPAPDGSVLSMTIDARGTNPVSNVVSAAMGKLLASNTRKALESDLNDIAKAAQARAVPGQGSASQS